MCVILIFLKRNSAFLTKRSNLTCLLHTDLIFVLRFFDKIEENMKIVTFEVMTGYVVSIAMYRQFVMEIGIE